MPEARFFQMDARNIPFENEFDVIGVFDVLEHIEEDEIVFSQIFRAVKSGGGDNPNSTPAPVALEQK